MMNTVAYTQEQEARFQSLMQASYKKVFSLAYRLSGSRADAEDLTQEAFFRAYRAFDTYQGDRPFENWIFRIVTRLYLDMRRRQGRRVQTVSYDAPLRPDGVQDSVHFEVADDRPTPEDHAVEQHLSDELEASLKSLTDEQRKLVLMADVEQIPYAEIAARLNAPVGTIRSRLHRAHRQLRSAVQEFRRNLQSGVPSPCGGC
ncbi:MAG: sigma-70 family RNA polymerase sigma factor [Fimbriimonadaceae bacterium]|nr:sigma-70 family RNA polymerase sigma factor [Fimbriimonadaceae bacterium]